MQLHYPSVIAKTAKIMMERKKAKTHKPEVVKYWFFMTEHVVAARDAGLGKPWVEPEREIYNLFNDLEKQHLKNQRHNLD